MFDRENEHLQDKMMEETERAKKAKEENYSVVGFVAGAIGGGVVKFFGGKAAKSTKATKFIPKGFKPNKMILDMSKKTVRAAADHAEVIGSVASRFE